MIGDGNPKRTDRNHRGQILQLLAFLVLAGFIYALTDPLENNRQIWPIVAYGAGSTLALAATEGNSDFDRFPFSFVLFFVCGWLGLIVSLFASGLGWFVGSLTCTHLLPAIGLEACQS